MPTLSGYTADIGGGPINGGRRADVTDFAPDLSPVAKELKSVGARMKSDLEENESRTALVSASQIRAKYAKALDDAVLSGADLAPIKEAMHNDLAKVGENFSTRKGVDAVSLYSANADLMFDEQANTINVTRARADAKVQGETFIRSESLLVQQDPSRLARSEQNVKEFMATYAGKLPPAQLAEMTANLKQDLNVAAALSVSRAQPEKALERLKAGEWDLTVAQRDQLIGKADQEIRTKRADEQYQHALKIQDIEEKDSKARDKQFAAIIGKTATRRMIMDDPDLKPATREHLITFMEERAKSLASGENKSDPVTKRNLWMAINAPDGDPKKIYNADAIFEAVKSGKLNTTDANQLNSLVAGQKDENGRGFATRLQGRMSVIVGAMRADPVYQNQPGLASDIQIELINRAEQKAGELRKENKSPDSLLDPESKDYLFKSGTISAVAKDVRQRQIDALPKAPQVNSKAEYDALEPGAPYIDSNGVRAIKPAGAKRRSTDGAMNGPSVGKIRGPG